MPTTDTSSPPAITRCCCSMERETVWRQSCDQAMYTVRKSGRKCFCPRSSGNKDWGRKWRFAATPAFAKPEIYEALEERGVKYAIRIPANGSLLRDIEELLTRPVGRPSHKPVVCYKGFLYFQYLSR